VSLRPSELDNEVLSFSETEFLKLTAKGSDVGSPTRRRSSAKKADDARPRWLRSRPLRPTGYHYAGGERTDQSAPLRAAAHQKAHGAKRSAL